MKKERIGLFGGTFNPIHSGHLKAAEIVQKRLFLDEVLFIPSYIPPHKKYRGIADPHHRLKMVELAVRSFPRFVPSSVEIDAQERSYSIITLGKVKKLYPRSLIFFILGIDAFLEIDTWKEYERVLEQCFFVVISRPGFHLGDAGNVLGGEIEGKMFLVPEAEALNPDMLDKYRIFLLPINALSIASTEIRKRALKGESIKSMVPGEVEAYIKENKLYQS
ncbi:MAG: nicotinate-nucleotide adenylyltransferase [Candidatus Aminicenantes bacterium]|nr:nicotinate-nucleotide adenylyltransferase [Candidatus Aminicenantes bacterium]MDH5706553.1 nicotinate-nucleotide adenylyltransferase [Candidatus Aminicenantes bacterium]